MTFPRRALLAMIVTTAVLTGTVYTLAMIKGAVTPAWLLMLVACFPLSVLTLGLAWRDRRAAARHRRWSAYLRQRLAEIDALSDRRQAAQEMQQLATELQRMSR